MHALLRRLPALAILAPLAACGARAPLDVACARPGIPSLRVEVRDDAGRAAARGATVAVRSERGYAASATGFVDSLTVAVGETEGGTFSVMVTKPWHAPAVLEGIRVPADACGVARPGRAAVVLAIRADAPPVRQVVVPPFGFGFGWGGLTARLIAFVEAAPGVSTRVVWVSRDTTVARITPEGVLTSPCRTTPGATWVVAAAAADPARQDSVRVSVGADTDPVRCPSL
jgi:hypothetical protein